MPNVYLCANVGGRQLSASSRAVDDLSANLSTLYFPSTVTPERLQALSATFGTWTVNITTPAKSARSHVSIAEYLEMLSKEEISPGFKEVLASISRTPKEIAHQDALRHFDISRFCEFRVALSALSLPKVQRVGVVPPNSLYDQMKADVLVFNEGDASAKLLQVKATEGRANRLSREIPTVKGAWKLKFSEMARELRCVFNEQRKGQLSPG